MSAPKKPCKFCAVKYADGRPVNFASDPKCAFDEDGRFHFGHNWNCAGLDQLREDAVAREAWCDDQHAAVLPVVDTGTFVLLTYYKHRGETEGAWRVTGGTTRPLTIADVDEYLEAR